MTMKEINKSGFNNELQEADPKAYADLFACQSQRNAGTYDESERIAVAWYKKVHGLDMSFL